MSASADIQTRTHKSVLAVPINSVAVREKNSDNAVVANSDDPNSDTKPDVQNIGNGDLDEVVFLVQRGDTVRKVKVHTDIQDINYIEVKDGLNEGDSVVTGPYSVISKTMKSGMRVKVVPKDKLFAVKKN